MILLVGCAPGRRSSVVRLVIFVASTATASAVFFVAIVYPVAGPRSAVVQCTTISNNPYPSMSDLSSRLFCKPGGRSQFVFAFLSVFVSPPPLVDIAGSSGMEVMRRSWRMSRANVDRTVQGGGSCGTCYLSAVASSMRPFLALTPTFLTPSLGPSSLSLSLRGPLGGAGARLSDLRPAPPPPRC